MDRFLIDNRKEYNNEYHNLVGNEKRTFQKNVSIKIDRKSTRLNSSHSQISYAVFCLKKKKNTIHYYILLESFLQSNPHAFPVRHRGVDVPNGALICHKQDVLVRSIWSLTLYYHIARL